MAHEITDTDNVYLHRERAWHGLGIVLPDALAPVPALELIGADWGVRQVPVFCDWTTPEGLPSKLMIPERVANVREDTGTVLGEVSQSCYRSFSNREVAEFCESLLERGADGLPTVLCESAGTIRGGAKLWFLLKGESFAIMDRDQIVPYVLVSNGHDGKTSLRVTPTTIRVVCSNTLHSVIPDDESRAGISTAALSIQHTGDLASKVAEAKRALATYEFALRTTRETAERLAQRGLTGEALMEYFVRLYAQDFAIPEPDQTAKVNDGRADRMKEAKGWFTAHFERNTSTAGPTWWNAFNSYSEFIQHDTRGRGPSDQALAERRMQSNLFGLGASRTLAAFQAAIEAAAL